MTRCALTAVLVMALSSTTRADPATVPTAPSGLVHLKSPRVACLGALPDLQGCVQLPAGFFLAEPDYSKLDAEIRRLQDAETRLTAQNASLRKSAASWQPGWVTTLTSAAGAVALAIYVEHKL